MADYDALRQELTRLSASRARSRSSAGRLSSVARYPLAKTGSGRSIGRARSRAGSQATSDSDVVEAVEGERPGDEDFDFGEFLRDGPFEKRTDAGDSAKKVGAVFKNLTVKGVGASVAFTKTLPKAIMGSFGPDLYHLLCCFIPLMRSGRRPPTRDLIHDFSGAIQDGEMMLVLGRPGPGYTTFLKAIANDRSSYTAVEGEVTYGEIPAKEQRRNYKGEVNYNPEDDQHFPALIVWQTLEFSLMNNNQKKMILEAFQPSSTLF
jgi:ATP-binding cassette, subfamily G (WHITE), member 2, SNQ2